MHTNGQTDFSYLYTCVNLELTHLPKMLYESQWSVLNVSFAQIGQSECQKYLLSNDTYVEHLCFLRSEIRLL